MLNVQPPAHSFKIQTFYTLYHVNNDRNIISDTRHFSPKPISFIEIVVDVYRVQYVSFTPHLFSLLTIFCFLVLCCLCFSLNIKTLTKHLNHYIVKTIVFDIHCRFRWYQNSTFQTINCNLQLYNFYFYNFNFQCIFTDLRMVAFIHRRVHFL